MKILLIGHKGQIGHELNTILSPRDDFTAIDHPAIDLANPDSIRSVLHEHAPDIVINAAGYTAVDKAESESDLATAINGTAVAVIAEELKKSSGALVHYSTDYVFDGAKSTPYTEDDTPNPISAYGRSKLAGEEALINANIPHLLLRTSWIYGAHGKNFLKTILRLAGEREILKIVDDQVGAPTWSRFVAEATVRALEVTGALTDPGHLTERGGLFHLTAAGETSWYGFAKEILRLNKDRRKYTIKHMVSVHSTDFQTIAPRPLNCRLDTSLIRHNLSISPPHWQESVYTVMQDPGIGKKS